MGNSKKGSAVEEKFVFTGVHLDFEQFRTVMHTHFEDKDQQWFPLVSQTIVKTYHNIVMDRTARNVTAPMQTDLNKFFSVYARHVDSSSLGFSLSSYRQSYIGLVCSSRFID